MKPVLVLDVDTETAVHGLWCDRCMLPSITRFSIVAHSIGDQGVSERVLFGAGWYCDEEGKWVPC